MKNEFLKIFYRLYYVGNCIKTMLQNGSNAGLDSDSKYNNKLGSWLMVKQINVLDIGYTALL